jgi:hypothetical protein
MDSIFDKLNTNFVMPAGNALKQAVSSAAQSAVKWATPPALSPIPEKTATDLFQPGGIKQAVNNVVALATFQPQLVRKFPTKPSPFAWVGNGQTNSPTIGLPMPTAKPLPTATPSPSPTPTTTQPYNQQAQAVLGIIQRLGQVLQQPSPTPTASPTPTPTPGPTREDYIQAMQAMIPEINPNTRLPVADYATTIYDETQKYPIFKKYPFLAVAQAILESSGFQKRTAENPKVGYDPAEPKRALGYAPYVEGYNPQDLKQVIADYASALGGRDAAIEKQTNPEGWQARMSTASNYQKFRDSGNLADLANTYAPAEDNPGTGGQTYANRLQWIMDRYQEALQNSLKQRIGKGNK